MSSSSSKSRITKKKSFTQERYKPSHYSDIFNHLMVHGVSPINGAESEPAAVPVGGSSAAIEVEAGIQDLDDLMAECLDDYGEDVDESNFDAMMNQQSDDDETPSNHGKILTKYAKLQRSLLITLLFYLIQKPTS